MEQTKKEEFKQSKQVIEMNNMLVDFLIKQANISKGITMLIDLYNNNSNEIDKLDILNNGEILISIKEFEDFQTSLVNCANLFFAKIDVILRALYEQQKTNNGELVDGKN